jgi:hypothetical protein
MAVVIIMIGVKLIADPISGFRPSRGWRSCAGLALGSVSSQPCASCGNELIAAAMPVLARRWPGVPFDYVEFELDAGRIEGGIRARHGER